MGVRGEEEEEEEVVEAEAEEELKGEVGGRGLVGWVRGWGWRRGCRVEFGLHVGVGA